MRHREDRGACAGMAREGICPEIPDGQRSTRTTSPGATASAASSHPRPMSAATTSPRRMPASACAARVTAPSPRRRRRSRDTRAARGRSCGAGGADTATAAMRAGPRRWTTPTGSRQRVRRGSRRPPPRPPHADAHRSQHAPQRARRQPCDVEPMHPHGHHRRSLRVIDHAGLAQPPRELHDASLPHSFHHTRRSSSVPRKTLRSCRARANPGTVRG